MRIQSFLISLIILSFIVSCKKEYERPDHFAVDLFKNERNEQKKRVLSAEEAVEKSLLVIKSDKTQLISSPKINNKTIFIYKIDDGKIIKGSKDSMFFPVRVISDQGLKINQGKKDSVIIYLIAPQSYKLLIKDFDVKYQILPSAPIL
ncbi:hypothetical protein LUD75_01100 [Epilithonimonas sp. JDS]|uniref:hypothetical protein n=1 Tax=Epilithonimonas sp. JDS TaxID=2902797 RepID=UPI001E42B8E4|nr:hypothetical protein [Epilithonimonas sp. JDS]MCD9853284.1 hypothetical protein [Epilithonimonas sp. JDS]